MNPAVSLNGGVCVCACACVYVYLCIVYVCMCRVNYKFADIPPKSAYMRGQKSSFFFLVPFFVSFFFYFFSFYLFFYLYCFCSGRSMLQTRYSYTQPCMMDARHTKKKKKKSERERGRERERERERERGRETELEWEHTSILSALAYCPGHRALMVSSAVIILPASLSLHERGNQKKKLKNKIENGGINVNSLCM